LELLERMEAGGFAATLSYVSIPALRHVPAIPPLPDYLDSTGRGVPPENPRLGRTDLIDVFNKLNDLEVTYIWRLEVEDRQRPSHTDAAIERAIQGRDPTVDQVPRRPISIHTW
jgi:hypothetical protein